MRSLIGWGLVGVLTLVSHHQAQQWADEATVWRSAVQAQPDSPRAWLNLCIATQADVACLKGWRLGLERERSVQRITEGVALVNLSWLDWSRQRPDAARIWALQAVTRFPDWPPAQLACERVQCLAD